MTDQELLNLYKSMLPFLADVCGSGSEIVLHDVTDPEHSLIAIEHPLSGRQVGDSMTDLARELQRKGTYTNESHIANYNGASKGRKFLSSTYFIKNEGRLIGLLCVNKDMTSVQEVSKALHQVVELFRLEAPSSSSYNENLDSSVTDLVQKRIEEIIQQYGGYAAKLSRPDKVRIVHQLDAEGLLSVKGIVPVIASELGISVPTLYRYLNRAK